MLRDIAKVFDEEVRPTLRSHGGDGEILSFEGGILRLRMLGQCAGCPAADLTNESLIAGTLQPRFPTISQVVLVHETSDALLEEARRLMTRSRSSAT